MQRRDFIAFLAGLPLVGRLFRKPKVPAVPEAFRRADEVALAAKQAAAHRLIRVTPKSAEFAEHADIMERMLNTVMARDPKLLEKIREHIQEHYRHIALYGIRPLASCWDGPSVVEMIEEMAHGQA